MFNLFANCEVNLGRAGWLLLLEVLGGAALGITLGQLALPVELAMLGAWGVNFVTAWYLSKAARALGKSALLYGLFSAIGPPASIASFALLHSHHALIQLARRMGATDDA
jgi:hypothetical protein